MLRNVERAGKMTIGCQSSESRIHFSSYRFLEYLCKEVESTIKVHQVGYVARHLSSGTAHRRHSLDI